MYLVLSAGITLTTAFLCASIVQANATGAKEGASHLSGQGASHLSAAGVDFERQIQPIIEKHCLECHSQDKRKGGLSLANYADALDGGRNGPAIRPGNAARSILIHRVTGAPEPQMPTDKEDRKSTRLNSSHLGISYAVFCLKKKNNKQPCKYND